LLPRIVVDEKVCFGKPVTKGIRVPVVVVLYGLVDGTNLGEIAEEHGITAEDVGLPSVMQQQ